MRWPIALAIFKKEILETSRDRRTLVVMLLLPVLLYPLLFVGFGQVVTHQLAVLRETEARIAVCGQLPPALAAQIAAEPQLRIVELDEMPPPPPTLAVTFPANDRDFQPPHTTGSDFDGHQWVTAVLAQQLVDCVIVVPADFDQRLTALEAAALLIYYDQTVQKSQAVEQQLNNVLARWRQQLRRQREDQVAAVPLGFSTPLVFDSINTANAARRGAFVIGRVVPIMLMLMVMLGAFYPAIDLTAGEKERGTMQTLLTAPALAAEIIFGKFLTVFIVAMLSAMVNLLSMGVAVAWLLRSAQVAEQVAFSIELSTLLALLLQLVPIAVFLSAVMLAVAAFAQSFKEAQNYLTPVYMLILVPSGIAAMPTVSLDAFTACFPVLNLMLLMREMLLQPPALELVAMVLLANAVYALLAIVAAVKIFQNETVLLGGSGSLAALFCREPGKPAAATPMLALSVFALNLVVLFYLGSYLQQTHMLYGMLATQWLLLFVPALLVIRVLQLPRRSTLSLYAPSWRSVLAALLLGITAWAVLGQSVHALQEMLLPMPRSFVEQMRTALGLDTGTLSIWLLLLVFALSPAICEEVFFRGLIMAGFRQRLANWQTLLLTGLLFGLFHISIYRILPTAVLGVLIALVVLRSGSLYTGIILHFCNNATALLLMKYGWLERLGIDGSQALDWRLAALTVAVFAAGLLLLLVSKKPAAAKNSAVSV